MKKTSPWLLPVIISIVASLASVFLPVLTYVYPSGQTIAFNLLGFIEPSQDLIDILASYDGPLEIHIDDRIWLIILAILGVLAIIAAFVGVITMSLQRPNTWNFVLALVGIIGTAIPAIFVIIAAPISQQFLPGTFKFGVYPIITPITMAMSMIAVTKKHKKTEMNFVQQQEKHRA